MAAAVGLMAGFRLGLLPGGNVGVDVALAGIGWWLATGGETWVTATNRIVVAWSVWWRPLVVAIALAIAWVLVSDDVALDPTVRGQALAAFGGYANWHHLGVGPDEVLRSRSLLPLQHVWAAAVAIQCTVGWLVVVAATRRRAQRRSGAADPAVAAGTAVAALLALGGLAMAVAGASGVTLELSTVPRGVAFFLGVAVGAQRGRPGGALRATAIGTRWLAVAGLAAFAFVAPTTELYRWSSFLLVPLLAAIVVVAAVPDRVPDPGATPASFGLEELVPWSGLVAGWVVLAPSLALVRAIYPDGSAVVIGAVGLLLAFLVGGAAVVLGAMASQDQAAVERRRVLVPPAVVGLLVVLFSVTGAFHWEGTQTRDQWESSSPAAGRPTMAP